MQTIFAQSGNQIRIIFFGKRQSGFEYNNPVIVSGATGYNQLLRPIQYFIFYQFQNRVHQQQFQFSRFFYGYPNVTSLCYTRSWVETSGNDQQIGPPKDKVV